MWDENWQGKRKYYEKACPSDNISATYITLIDPVRRDEKPATNHMGYGTAGNS
jgi:hypothetical protein